MSLLAWAGGIAAVAAGLVALASALGMSWMRAPLQRLHFVTPAATVSSALLALGFWMAEPAKTAAAKASLALLLLFGVNGVVGQATGRSIRSRSGRRT